MLDACLLRLKKNFIAHTYRELQWKICLSSMESCLSVSRLSSSRNIFTGKKCTLVLVRPIWEWPWRQSCFMQNNSLLSTMESIWKLWLKWRKVFVSLDYQMCPQTLTRSTCPLRYLKIWRRILLGTCSRWDLEGMTKFPSNSEARVLVATCFMIGYIIVEEDQPNFRSKHKIWSVTTVQMMNVACLKS